MSTHGVAAAAATKKGTSTARCIGRTQRVSLFSMYELHDQIKTIGTMTSKGAAPFWTCVLLQGTPTGQHKTSGLKNGENMSRNTTSIVTFIGRWVGNNPKQLLGNALQLPCFAQFQVWMNPWLQQLFSRGWMFRLHICPHLRQSLNHQLTMKTQNILFLTVSQTSICFYIYSKLYIIDTFMANKPDDGASNKNKTEPPTVAFDLDVLGP